MNINQLKRSSVFKATKYKREIKTQELVRIKSHPKITPASSLLLFDL